MLWDGLMAFQGKWEAGKMARKETKFFRKGYRLGLEGLMLMGPVTMGSEDSGEMR